MTHNDNSDYVFENIVDSIRDIPGMETVMDPVQSVKKFFASQKGKKELSKVIKQLERDFAQFKSTHNVGNTEEAFLKFAEMLGVFEEGANIVITAKRLDEFQTLKEQNLLQKENLEPLKHITLEEDRNLKPSELRKALTMLAQRIIFDKKASDNKNDTWGWSGNRKRTSTKTKSDDFFNTKDDNRQNTKFKDIPKENLRYDSLTPEIKKQILDDFVINGLKINFNVFEKNLEKSSFTRDDVADFKSAFYVMMQRKTPLDEEELKKFVLDLADTKNPQQSLGMVLVALMNSIR